MNKPMCSECDEDDPQPVEIFCSDCQLSYCSNCSSHMHALKTKRNHKLEPWNNQSSSIKKEENNNNCPLHPDYKLHLVCCHAKCNKKKCCLMCASHGEHKGHETLPFADAIIKINTLFNTIKPNLKSKMDPSVETRKELRAFLLKLNGDLSVLDDPDEKLDEKLGKGTVNDALKEIDEFEAVLHKKVLDKFNKLREKVKQKAARKEKEAVNQYRELSIFVNNALTLLSEMEGISMSNDINEVLTRTPLLEENIEKSMKLNVVSVISDDAKDASLNLVLYKDVEIPEIGRIDDFIVVKGIKSGKKVLISGDFNGGKGSTSTEIYDSDKKSFEKGPELKVARREHASVTIPTGNLFICGGYNSTSKELSSCEIVDPKNKTSVEVGSMKEKRNGCAAVLISDNLVLIIGGGDGSKYLQTCEIFDLSTKTFTLCKGKMNTARWFHTAHLLSDGNVLICGGHDGSNYLQSTEIYNVKTDSFTSGPNMKVKRCNHASSLLLDGKILITGGEDRTASTLLTELYDPTTKSFVDGPKMNVARRGHSSSLLADGKVLITGGDDSSGKTLKSTEIYDPITKLFTIGSNLLTGRYCHSSSPV